MTTGLTLLAFDFDGTLAPIHDDPAAEQLHRGAAALLDEASHMQGIVVAIVSGRDADDVRGRVDAPGAYLITSRGLSIHAPGGARIHETPPLAIEPHSDLGREITATGLRLESKKHGLALHWRGVPYEAIAPVEQLFRRWATDSHLDVIEGPFVVEARRPGGGKEPALRWLARALGATRVVYAGDDITDFGPLRFASECGRALFVASGERVPPAGVTVVGSFRELFRIVREEVMI